MLHRTYIKRTFAAVLPHDLVLFLVRPSVPDFLGILLSSTMGPFCNIDEIERACSVCVCVCACVCMRVRACGCVCARRYWCHTLQKRFFFLFLMMIFAFSGNLISGTHIRMTVSFTILMLPCSAQSTVERGRHQSSGNIVFFVGTWGKDNQDGDKFPYSKKNNAFVHLRWN